MSYLPVTILAYLLNSIAVIIDKFLLNKAIPNPLTYVFYISMFSLVMLLALPFTHLPSIPIFVLASLSTLFWTLGAYLMFKAIKIGQVSSVVPIIGTLIPVLLLLHAAFFAVLPQSQLLAAGILILGLIILVLPQFHLGKEIFWEFLSALFFALSYLVLREAFQRENFLTVLVYSRFVLIPLGLAVFFMPKTPKVKLNRLFLVGQAAGGAQQLLLIYAISLASPALVNSLQGVQYVFLFLFSLILAKKFPAVFEEKRSLLILLSKILGIGLIGVGLYLLAF